MLGGALVAMVLVPACDHGSVVGSCLSLDDFRNCKGGPVDVPAPCDGGGGSGGQAHGGGGGSSEGGGGCTPGHVYSCYSGPKATKHVGLCHDGKAKCLADGVSYGKCVGDRTPTLEDASKEGDEDCDGNPSSDTLWAENFGDDLEQSITSLAIQPKGKVVAVGRFNGGIHIGKTTLSAPDGGGFLAQFEMNGKANWALKLPPAAGVSALATDTAGAIYVTGTWKDVSAVNLGQSSGFGKVFVAKLAPDGTPIWSRGCGGGSIGGGRAISVGPDGSVSFGGFFTETLNCGTGSFARTGGRGMFVAAFSRDGVPLWTDAFGGSGAADDVSPRAVSVDASGNTWVSGDFEGSLDFGTGPRSATGQRDGFLAHFDNAGISNGFTWGDPTKDEQILGMALDKNAGPLVAVNFEGTLDFGNGKSVTSAGGIDIALAKFNASNNISWVKSFGGPMDQDVTGVGYDNDGNILVHGIFTGSLDFGGGALTASSETMAAGCLAKLSPTGGFIWAKAYQGDPQFRSMIVEPETNVAILGGELFGKAVFGSKFTLSTPTAADGDAVLLAVAP